MRYSEILKQELIKNKSADVCSAIEIISKQNDLSDLTFVEFRNMVINHKVSDESLVDLLDMIDKMALAGEIDFSEDKTLSDVLSILKNINFISNSYKSY